MFGEKVLLGQREGTVDNKGRIFMPANTKHGDELVVLYDKDINLYRIYGLNTVEKMLEDLNKKILESTDEKEKKCYTKESYKLCKLIFSSVKIDGQGRANVGNLYNTNKVLIIGDYDNLIIEPKIEPKIKK